MAIKKKLQVFISSTYSDLIQERQAAVEAVLAAGHIPAGMELFAAADTTQMEVIRRWIDESDVFLLILGGRYGSIEPTSGKSYIHLEYEYALELGKALFAVVITEDHLEKKLKILGREAIELENVQKLKQFRNLVLSRMVRFWSDSRDIKLSILETMNLLNDREDLVGWIRGDEADVKGELKEDESIVVTKLLNEKQGEAEERKVDTRPGLKSIKVFLASSKELAEDRKQVEIWVRRENNRLVKKGVFLKLNLWEDFLDSISQTRLQDEYNQVVAKSDIFISLFSALV